MFRLVVALSVLCLVAGESEDRIVNGRGASVNEFPYQVSLQLNGRHNCGGSVLNEKWVLTAAHCVADVIKANQVHTLTVRAGTSTWPSGGVLKNVELVKVHESYNPRNMNNDVALCKIVGQFVYSAVLKPVRILKTPLRSGVPVVVSGWGQLSHMNSHLPTFMQAVQMTYLPAGECARMHPGAITDAMVCAIGPGQDSCNGDSGGPLCIPNTLIQVGVVSWGIQCAAAGLPGVYVDLTNRSIVSFLERNVGKLP